MKVYKKSNDEFNGQMIKDLDLFYESPEYLELGFVVPKAMASRLLIRYFIYCKILMSSFVDIRIGLVGIFVITDSGIKSTLLKTLVNIERVMEFNNRTSIYNSPNATENKWKISEYIDDCLLIFLHVEMNPKKKMKPTRNAYHRDLMNKILYRYIMVYEEPFKVPIDLKFVMDEWIDNENFYEYIY